MLNRELVLPMHPENADLAGWLTQGNCDFVPCDRFRKSWIGIMLSPAMSRELARLGLSVHLNVHGSRKLSLPLQAEAGCTPHRIAAVRGQSILEMVELYTRSANQAELVREAFAAQTNPKRKRGSVREKK